MLRIRARAYFNTGAEDEFATERGGEEAYLKKRGRRPQKPALALLGEKKKRRIRGSKKNPGAPSPGKRFVADLSRPCSEPNLLLIWAATRPAHFVRIRLLKRAVSDDVERRKNS